MQELFRRLPGVDNILDQPDIRELAESLPRFLLLKAARLTLEGLRVEIGAMKKGDEEPDLSMDRILGLVRAKAGELNQPNYRRLINATGVIIHTNLGRSPLALKAMEAVELAGKNYSNLEFDVKTGRRGSRYSHVEELLCDLTGAEAGLVVNNNAAAVLLVLQSLGKGKEVIVSRGELVEIGGSFRIPDVMAASGAIMKEVGATNKTHLKDYARAITEDSAILMKVHQSNFHMVGFTEAVDIADLVNLGREKGLVVVEDLGSGALIDLSRFGLKKEPTVQETISAGVDIVTFSGDKLLGGPQAGLILGKKDIIDQIKAHPLNRALRIDKFTLASLEATLRLYLDESKALDEIPILSMITKPASEIKKIAQNLKRKLKKIAGASLEIDVIDGISRIGGGALPFQEIPTSLICLLPRTMTVNQLEERIRNQPVPIIGRIENERLILDLRTVHSTDLPILLDLFSDILSKDSV